MIVLFAAALAAIPTINNVQAATVSFSIIDDPTVNIPGCTHLGGTLTGTLYGLADNGFSKPTSILITSDVSAFGMSGDLFTSLAVGGTGFELIDGTVVGANVAFNILDLNDAQFHIRLNYLSYNILV